MPDQKLPVGQHRFRLTVTDDSGNKSTPAVVSVIVADTTAPTAVLDLDQAAVEDARLSWAARGLLACLLSRPDDWKVLVNDLKKRGNLGRGQSRGQAQGESRHSETDQWATFHVGPSTAVNA